MARLLYGATPADFAVALGESAPIPGVTPEVTGKVTLIPETAVVFLVYETAGGTQVTDLELPGGIPVSQVESSPEPATLGTIPPFYGPDGWTGDLWVSADATAYYRLPPSTEDLHERVAAVETAISGLVLDDMSDVQLAGGTDNDVLTLSSGQIVPRPAGSGTVSTINNVAPVAGNVTLTPANLSPAAATAAGLSAIQAIVGARLLQVGAGYPPRPAAAQYIHYIGTVTPTTGVQDGDTWDQPVVS